MQINVLQLVHSYWAYLVLILIVVSIVASVVGLAGKKDFLPSHRKLALFALIATHVQFLFGIIHYFLSPITRAAMNDVGASMKNAMQRLYLVEHPAMMLLGIVLITIGFSRMKKAEGSPAKFKQVVIFYSLGLILILSRIPYGAWL